MSAPCLLLSTKSISSSRFPSSGKQTPLRLLPRFWTPPLLAAIFSPPGRPVPIRRASPVLLSVNPLLVHSSSVLINLCLQHRNPLTSRGNHSTTKQRPCL